MVHSMKSIYRTLKKISWSKSKIRSLLPDWWDDRIAQTEAGMQEALWLIANTLSLDYISLLNSLNDDKLQPQYRFTAHQFKHSKNISQEKLEKAVAIAILVAKQTLKAFDSPLKLPSNKSASTLRSTLLEQSNWINFETLVKYCFSIGIPVIYADIGQFTSPKMDGIALNIYDRPVIVLSKNRRYGYLVFDLAHELGHIMLEHINEDDSMMIDKKIEENTQETNEHEQAATAYGLELLTGNSDRSFIASKISPEKLAKVAIARGQDLHIDPLHILCNYGYSCDQFQLAENALKVAVKQLDIIETDQQIARKIYQQYVDINTLSEPEFLLHLMGEK